MAVHKRAPHDLHGLRLFPSRDRRGTPVPIAVAGGQGGDDIMATGDSFAAADRVLTPEPRLYPNVHLGKNARVDPFCVIGYPPAGAAPGDIPTYVGDNVHIRSHSLIYAGCTLGDGVHIGHGTYIREFTTIGARTSIGVQCMIEHHVAIGAGVRVQGQTGICEHTIIEDEAWIGPKVIFSNVSHPTCPRAKECLAGPIVRRKAILASGVVLCPDVEIGEGAFIGAGSVITRSVENHALMFGNPAKKVGEASTMQCRYDMMDGKPAYPVEPRPEKIPLVDLAAQHQSKKEILRLAMDRVVLNTRFIQGKEVREFEEAFARFADSGGCVAVSSGTSALELALRALDVGHADEVIVPSHTFIACAEAIAGVGAVPVFVDVTENGYVMDPADVARKIGPRTKAIMAVHLYGLPAPMDAIREIAAKHGLKVIGDASQAHGAIYKGTAVARWADATTFSFYPGKNLGAYGDAGAVVSADQSLLDRVRLLRDHGRAAGEKYRHAVLGTNARMDTIQAAVLLAKLPFLADWNQRRAEVAARYRDSLGDLDLILPEPPVDATHVYHLFVVRSARRDALASHLKEHGIATGIHYPIPLHQQPACSAYVDRAGTWPVTERIVGEILSLPMYPELRDTQVTRITDTIRAFHGDRAVAVEAR
jgi:dTDP-4-amino-4,6-dideoxygalactose transaminase/acetyltransferase-like isoleucine patch superfamily enzyme